MGAELTPTDEQAAILTEARAGKALTIQAGAGTGKTSSLRMLANELDARGQYVAFNRSLVDEAAATFPDSCSVRTMHSLAYRAVVDQNMARRLRGPRVKSDQIARQLGIGPLNVTFGQQTKVLQPGFLAGLVMKSVGRFCDSADKQPSQRHVAYIDGIDPMDGAKRTYENNDRVAQYLEPFLHDVWADVQNPNGRLPFHHAHYQKIWELSGPRIVADYLVVDEGQDLNPVQLSICEQQSDHLQLIAVGDSAQQIYSWRGAVNALDRFETDMVLYLSQSFRFGPAIADVANTILEKLDAELRLKGLDSITSSVDRLAQPGCVLTRTNALAVSTLIQEQTAGRAAYLIGGGEDVQRFVKAVVELQTKGYTGHPDLACFSSWSEVCAYVADDPGGDDLALLVRLIQDHGADEIMHALDRMPRNENGADVVISTAHKAKGREWSSVQLGADFRDPKDGSDLGAEEWRLLYVAATRAKDVLDPHRAKPLARLLGLEPDDDGPGATVAPTPPAPERLGAPTGGRTAPGHAEGTAPAAAGPQGSARPAERVLTGTGEVALQPGVAQELDRYRGAPVPPRRPQFDGARTRRAAEEEASAAADAEPTWLIGKCGPGCRYGVKIRGVMLIENHRFVGVFVDGRRVHVPACPEHGRRPYLRVLRILPPDGSRCNSSCQHATKPECACSCRGDGHGKAHLVDLSALESAS